jgi:glucose/arabinose dehydrogenase
VVEHTAGRVRYVVDGVLQSPAAFVLGSAGTGVLGIAIHHANPPEVFLYIEDMTETVGNRVNSYTWNAALGVLENQQLVHQFPPGAPGSQHDAGVMVIGPESESGAGAPYLYVAAGDRQGNGQLQNNPAGAPPDDSGVILRIRRDGTPAPGNPFTPYCSATTTTSCNNDNGCPGAETCVVRVAKYYAYGIRNHFGLVFDPITRQLWDTENGDLTWDEVNRVEPGMNSGWMKLQGPGDPNSVTLFNMPGAGSTYSDPEFAWFVPTGPTGITFPVNSTLGPDYQRSLLFGDFNQPGRIYALPLNLSRTALDTAALPANLRDATADTRAELDPLVFGTGFTGSVLDLEMGPDGALYVATYFDGRIYRISGPHLVPVPSLPASGLAGLAAALLVIAAFGMNKSDSAHGILAEDTRSANAVIPDTVALKRHLTCASG